MKPGQNRGIQISIQANQGKSACIQTDSSVREKALVEQDLIRVRKTAADKRQAGVGKVAFPGLGQSLICRKVCCRSGYNYDKVYLKFHKKSRNTCVKYVTIVQ